MQETKATRALGIVDAMQRDNSTKARNSAKAYAEKLSAAITLLIEFDDKSVQSIDDLREIKKAIALKKDAVIMVTLDNGAAFVYDLNNGVVASYSGRSFHPEADNEQVIEC